MSFGFRARRARVKRGFADAKKCFEAEKEVEDASRRREEIQGDGGWENYSFALGQAPLAGDEGSGSDEEAKETDPGE